MNKYSIIHVLGFMSKIFRKLRISKFICKRYNDSYHLLIQMKLKPYFDKALMITKREKSLDININSNIIWIFWWQGIQYAPHIVKKCISSIINYSNGHKVIIVSKNNIDKYTNIPNYIYNRLKNNEISLTHFSDILRFNLLKNYGGLWIDSTIYCTSNINKRFSSFYTSGGYSNPYHFFVSSKWTGFLIGGNKKNIIFNFMDIFFRLYWKYNNRLIDYFLIDYALNYIYQNNIGNFKIYIDKRAWKNNPHLHKLQDLLNCKYNKKKYLQIISDTNVFKLTYKKKFKNNGKTFYSKILK